MSAKTHAILSELHRLLSAYSSRDLLDASSHRTLTPGMKRALRSLAAEVGDERTRESSRTRKGNGRPSEEQHYPRLPDHLLLDALRHSSISSSKQSLVDFARIHGLKLAFGPKESKERVVRKLMRAITGASEEARERIVADLRNSESSQTRGWIEVLKSGR